LIAQIVWKGKPDMETRLTTWDAAVQLAAKVGISPQQVKAILQAQAELAYQHVEGGYPIAGIGTLCKVERPERKMKMVFGPKKGQAVIIPAKQTLTFQIARAAKDIVFGRITLASDVTKIDLAPEEESSENKE
jgi:nucleoid DNA-binding protein